MPSEVPNQGFSSEPGIATRRFLVGFSFDGETRDFVGQVAKLLAAKIGKPRILYDKFCEAEFARPDLGFYLPKLHP